MKKRIIGLVFITLISLASLTIIAVNFDPFKTGYDIKFLFFVSLFAVLWGSGTIVFLLFNYSLTNAFRWSLLFSLGVIALIFLNINLL